MYFAARRIEQLSAALFAATPTSTLTTATFPRATATNFEADDNSKRDDEKTKTTRCFLSHTQTHTHTLTTHKGV